MREVQHQLECTIMFVYFLSLKEGSKFLLIFKASRTHAPMDLARLACGMELYSARWRASAKAYFTQAMTLNSEEVSWKG